MASKNVETLTRAHQAFNARKLDECVGYFADGGVYRDIPRGVDFRGRAELMSFMQGWITGFSDIKVLEATYLDAGEIVIAQFKGQGTNDGPLGTFAPTKKRLTLPYCEVVKFANGKISLVTAYYDLLTLLSQLGHLQAPRGMMAQPGATP